MTAKPIFVTGTDAVPSQTNNCPASLAAEGSCTIAVTFNPAAKGNLTAAVTIKDNAAGSPQEVNLTGTGK